MSETIRINPNRVDSIERAAEQTLSNASKTQFGAASPQNVKIREALDAVRAHKNRDCPFQPGGWRLFRQGVDFDQHCREERVLIHRLFGALCGVDVGPMAPTEPTPPVVPKRKLTYLESLQRQMNQPEKKVVLT